MKILHITTVRTGSTGRTASDLKSYLTSKGEEYSIAFSIPDQKPLDGDILIGNYFDHKLHALLSRLTGLQGYFSYFATRAFLKKVKAYQPDLVQLGNLHANYINLPLMFRFLAKERIPVVMILHDCWFFTGGCTHFTAINCVKWKTECRHCSVLKESKESWFFDRSRKAFQDRKKWYGNLASLTVSAVSDWEKELAKQSPLFSKANVVRNYNWINTDTFKPATQEQIQEVRQKYKLSSKVKYVVTVSAGWSMESTRTKDAIRLSSILPDEYRLIVVGGAEAGIFPQIVVSIPHTSDQKELAALYTLSSAYLHFSVEDTFGKVIAEAMACETVPVVFDSTACGETASPYGIAVKPHDVEAMAGAIPLANDVKRKRKVRDYALSHYNALFNKERYYSLFKEIIDKTPNSNEKD